MNHLKGKKILILGLGISGRSAVGFLLQQGAFVTGTDQNIQKILSHPDLINCLQAGLRILPEEEIHSLNQFDYVVVSPGVSPSTHLYQEACLQGVKIMGEFELGCHFIQNPMIGITGTNGKTTVTLLVAHALNQGGVAARALGNIGLPLTKEITTIQPQEVLVAELSSYQLETLRQPILDVGVILNITPDHLDRYQTMENYAKAKFKLGNCLKQTNTLYVEQHTWEAYQFLSPFKDVKTYGYDSTCFIYTDLDWVYLEHQPAFRLPQQLQGKRSHDIENVMAAYALCREYGLSHAQFASSLESFTKPSHRIEFVLEREGISYYDDSKGTNLDAVIRAVETLQGPIVLIAGGVDKGAAYTPWLKAFGNKVKCIYAIGQAAVKIKQDLTPHLSIYLCDSLEQAVLNASRVAQSGDNVLLSPGCASYDMFRDYAHRGEEFQRIVRQLVKGGKDV